MTYLTFFYRNYEKNILFMQLLTTKNITVKYLTSDYPVDNTKSLRISSNLLFVTVFMITKMGGSSSSHFSWKKEKYRRHKRIILLKINFDFKHNGINNESFQTIERNRTKYLMLNNRINK